MTPEDQKAEAPRQRDRSGRYGRSSRAWTRATRSRSTTETRPTRAFCGAWFERPAGMARCSPTLDELFGDAPLADGAARWPPLPQRAPGGEIIALRLRASARQPSHRFASEVRSRQMGHSKRETSFTKKRGLPRSALPGSAQPYRSPLTARPRRAGRDRGPRARRRPIRASRRSA